MAYFSVIIPLYNKENFIEDTLESVLSQTFRDFEIIIVNDGSTDGSEEKALQFTDSRIHYFLKENGGVSSARNLGIEKANSNYITFLDADDYWYPDFLETMAELINQFPEQKVFSGAIEIETSKNVFPARYSIQKTNDYDWEVVNYFDASIKETVICTSCAAFHKSIFEEIGNFDLNIKSGQDTDLWIRIGLKDPVVFTWKILARYIYDENSLSKNTSLTNNKLNFAKFKEEEKLNPALKRFLDLNRFSLAVKSKLLNEELLFSYYHDEIDKGKLPFRKRFLLGLPPFSLRKLISFKTFLANIGFGSSVFK